MKIVITGGKGMLGRTLAKELATNEIVIADLPEWDILDANSFRDKLAIEKADVVIHCAAMTKVDDCESNRELAMKLNEEGSKNVAIACRDVGSRLIAISTDYVFSGENREDATEWRETDVPRPQTVYGLSKFAGEQAVLNFCPGATIVRIAWLYGAGGPSFVHTMMKLGAMEGEALKVVNDQIGNPTSTVAVASAIKFLIANRDVSGIVHATCEGIASWYEFAMEIKKLSSKFTRDIVPCSTDEFPRPAPRPKNSALAKDVLAMLGFKMMNWRDALSDFIAREFS